MIVEMPKKCLEVLGASNKRYRLLFGGRGSAKSWSVARYLVTIAAFGEYRILCTREQQNSIRDSVYRLLVDQIFLLKLEQYFIIQKDSIYSVFGSEFIFKGIKHNISEIKSMEGVNIVWCEEAEKISEESWTILIPTIRSKNSEIIVTWNPETDACATDLRFCKNSPPDCVKSLVNYVDNPWFPNTLEKEMQYDKKVDFEKYEHVWLGKYKRYADALIFKGKITVEDFITPDEVQLYFGADFGFSVDPSVLVRVFIANRKLYIDYEAYGVGVELTDLHQFFASVPGSNKWQIIADSQRPDTISFLSQAYKAKNGTTYPGYDIRGAEKGKGSVEDGIEFLRGFEQIVIHPRCKGSIDNYSNYKWKQDRITQACLPIPVDSSNHVPDACRYALERLIKSKTSIFDLEYKSLNQGNFADFLAGDR